MSGGTVTRRMVRQGCVTARVALTGRPARARPSVERRIAGLRQKRGLGPARIAGIVRVPASTVHRVLVRQGLNRLDHLDWATRLPVRRIEMSRPGELVHVDIKKLGRIPVWWRMASPRPWTGEPVKGDTGRLRLRPHRYRWLFATGVLRGPRRRAGAHRGRVLAASRAVLRRARILGGTCTHRQRRLLSIARLLSRGRQRPPQLHPALSTSDQRQGRAFQSHPPGRMGLPPDLDLRRSAQSPACPLAPHLQPSPSSHRHRGSTHRPCQQPGWAYILDLAPFTAKYR